MRTHKFSIVIPVYNVAPYLRECLDSVLAQTFTDWEAICVDDGSTDGSGAILDEYAAKDSRFRVVHQKNAGVSAARNSAFSHVQGAWIGALDPDDVLAPNWLKVANENADSNQVDVLMMSCIRGREVPDWAQIDLPGLGSSEDLRTFPAVSKSFDGFFSMWRCFVRRGVMEGITFSEAVHCKEDALFILTLLPRINCLRRVNYQGYFYRCRTGSITARRLYESSSAAFVDGLTHAFEASTVLSDEGKNFYAKMLSGCIEYEICNWVRYHHAGESGKVLCLAYRRAYSAGLIYLAEEMGFWSGLAVRAWRKCGLLSVLFLTDAIQRLMSRVRAFVEKRKRLLEGENPTVTSVQPLH